MFSIPSVFQDMFQEQQALQNQVAELGWKVVKDPINSKDESIVGKLIGGYKGGKSRIRLLDDDGTVYFYLTTDYDYDKGSYEADILFYPLDTLGRSYGCTELQYKTSTGEYKTL